MAADQRISVPGVAYLWKSPCWKKVMMMHSALLQHSCSRSIPLQCITVSSYWSIILLHIPVSFPTCALKSLKSTVDSLALSFLWVSPVFFHECRVLCTSLFSSTLSWYCALLNDLVACLHCNLVRFNNLQCNFGDVRRR